MSFDRPHIKTAYFLRSFLMSILECLELCCDSWSDERLLESDYVLPDRIYDFPGLRELCEYGESGSLDGLIELCDVQFGDASAEVDGITFPRSERCRFSMIWDRICSHFSLEVGSSLKWSSSVI
jgi:hypothetical protein